MSRRGARRRRQYRSKAKYQVRIKINWVLTALATLLWLVLQSWVLWYFLGVQP